jgi:hypothetical protein
VDAADVRGIRQAELRWADAIGKRVRVRYIRHDIDSFSALKMPSLDLRDLPVLESSAEAGWEIKRATDSQGDQEITEVHTWADQGVFMSGAHPCHEDDHEMKAGQHIETRAQSRPSSLIL